MSAALESSKAKNHGVYKGLQLPSALPLHTKYCRCLLLHRQTGLLLHRQTGLLLHRQTGLLLHRQTGLLLHRQTGLLLRRQTGLSASFWLSYCTKSNLGARWKLIEHSNRITGSGTNWLLHINENLPAECESQIFHILVTCNKVLWNINWISTSGSVHRED
jgi:hypothetical protein